MGARGKLKLVEHPATPPETVQSVVPAVAPKKPAGVEADADLSTLWDEVVPELDRTGLITPADLAAVEVMLRHLLVVRMAHRAIAKDGVIVDARSTEDGQRKHPAEAVLRMESAAVMGWADKLGMTWMSRARTQHAPKGGGLSGDEDNVFAAPASGE
jgi:P27 family predicted phage terminase small subunit